MSELINKLHKSIFLGRIFHTLDYCLQRELKDCKTVLDLGCGPSSPLQYCKNINYSVGVEIFKPYLEKSKDKKIHTEYIEKKIEDVDFPENSFDAVILIEVLEHLPEDIGNKVLINAEKWAKNKIIVSTPNGYFPMETVDKNNYQKHLSGWNINKLCESNFKCYGLSGAKFFYLKKNTVQSILNNESFYSNIRFRPKKLFYLINGIVQIFSYFIPEISFGILAVKYKKYV